MSTSTININLESLLALSGRLNETYDELFILNSALLSLMGKLRIFRGAVLLPDAGYKKYKMILAKGKANLDAIDYFDVKELRTLDKYDGCESMLCHSGYEFCLPVIYQNTTLAVICLGNRLDGTPHTEEEEHYARLVSTITANAMQNARNRSSLVNAKNNLEKQNQLLTTLFEMSYDFSALLSKPHILKMLSYRLMGQLMVSRFAVFLRDSGGFHAIINRFESEPPETIVKELSCTDRTSRVGDIEIPAAALSALRDIKAEVVSPMINQGTCKGLLVIGKKMNGESFTDENLQFIEVLGNTAITALENERLFQEELEKKRLESELKLALEIQTNLLPDSLPSVSGYDFAGTSIPSRHVGGDYFDFITLPDGRTLIAIADVSGKGMPAALLMANVQAALRSLAPLMLPLNELAMMINNIVFHNTAADKFVTFFCGILDTRTGQFDYLNAGHNPPIVLKKDGSLLSLTEGGLILGFMETPFPYTGQVTELATGDVLLLYTDGVTEALNVKNEEFGETSLHTLLVSKSGQSAKHIMNSVIEAVKTHSDGLSQTDDITLVVIKAVN